MNRFLVVLYCTKPAMVFACINPGTGAHIVQALFALIVASLAYIRHAAKALYAKREGRSLCTRLLDLANLRPELGWRHAEFALTLQRARRRFDAMLCVGLIHQLLVTRKCKDIAGPNLQVHLNPAVFYTALTRGWSVEQRLLVLSKDRVLYPLRRRGLRESRGT
jgi:hypothetical protein